MSSTAIVRRSLTKASQISSPTDLVGKRVCTVVNTTSAPALSKIGVQHTAAQQIEDCYTGLRDKTPNGPEEQAEQAWMDSEKGYKTALLSTLQRTRALVKDGTL